MSIDGFTVRAPSVARDASVTKARVVNAARVNGGVLEASEPDLQLDDRRLLIDVPGDFTDMLAQDPERARAWRLTTRAGVSDLLLARLSRGGLLTEQRIGGGDSICWQRDG